MKISIKNMLKSDVWGNDTDGYIKFKYYGDFDDMKWIYENCKNDISFIGTSRNDGSPVFVYEFRNIQNSDILDFKKLNIILRKLKVKFYSGKEMDSNEKSIFTFFRFFMKSYENRLIKGVGYGEINKLQKDIN